MDIVSWFAVHIAKKSLKDMSCYFSVMNRIIKSTLQLDMNNFDKGMT